MTTHRKEDHIKFNRWYGNKTNIDLLKTVLVNTKYAEQDNQQHEGKQYDREKYLKMIKNKNGNDKNE